MPTSSTSSLVASELAGSIFDLLAAIYGKGIAEVYAGADPELVRQQWGAATVSLAPEEIRRGLDACRSRRFAPNLPDFLALCRPALDSEVAWNEAEQGMRARVEGSPFAWSHPAVFWAAQPLQHELRTLTFPTCRRRWETAMSAQWASGQWDPIPAPPQRIAHQESFTPSVSEHRREQLLRKRDVIVGRLAQRMNPAGVVRNEPEIAPGSPADERRTRELKEQADQRVREYLEQQGLQP